MIKLITESDLDLQYEQSVTKVFKLLDSKFHEGFKQFLKIPYFCELIRNYWVDSDLLEDDIVCISEFDLSEDVSDEIYDRIWVIKIVFESRGFYFAPTFRTYIWGRTASLDPDYETGFKFVSETNLQEYNAIVSKWKIIVND